jgi:hypothetical protein
MSNFPSRWRILLVGQALAGLAGVATAAPAPAALPAPASPVLSDNGSVGPDASFRTPLALTVRLGFRSDLVRSAGLDAFSGKDNIPQSALSVSRRFGPSESFGLALGLEWDHGRTDAISRGADASLVTDRLSVTIEGSVPIRHRLAGFVRVAPGFLHQNASLADRSAPGDPFGSVGSGDGILRAEAWVPAADVSAGLDLRLGELDRLGTPLLAFRLTGEGGYGYARAQQLALTPNVATQPGRTDEPLRLGDLALRGPFLRIQLGVSF